MTTAKITAKNRTKSTNHALNKLRRDGNIPAVVYGLKIDPVNIELGSIEMKKFINNKNLNQIIELDIEGKIEKVLLKEYVVHAVRDTVIMHIDFLRVNDTHPVTVKVPVTYHGVPFGVKSEGGQFQSMKKFVTLKCKVGDIPEAFDNDVSDLKATQVVYVRDLVFEKGRFITPAKTALFGISKGRNKDAEADTEAEK